MTLPSEDQLSRSGVSTDHEWVAVLRTAERLPGARLDPGDTNRHRLQVLVRGASGAPAVAEGGGCTLLLDGTLHNRDDLKAVVGGSGAAEARDAELLLAAYLRRGVEAIRRLRGMFALAIWNSEDETLLCARDPIGVYPLFYTRVRDGSLGLSTDARSLLRHLDVEATINRLVLAGHVCELWPTMEETLHSAVSRVLPGHLLRIRRDSLSSERYWDPEVVSFDDNWQTEEVDRRFAFLVRRAVRRCLDQGPAAVLLSGGIDSAVVAASAVDVSREHDFDAPIALSVIAPPPAREEDTQKALASALKMPQLTYPADYEGILLDSLRLNRVTAVPSVSVFRASFEALIQAAGRQGCRVVFSGDGGDEWFEPANVVAADRLIALDVRALYGLWKTWSGYFPTTARTTLKAAVWSWGARPLVKALAVRSLRRLRPDALTAHRTRRLLTTLPNWLLPDPALRRDFLDQVMEAEPDLPLRNLERCEKRRMLTLANIILDVEDSFAMRHWRGIHLVRPLLDADLVEFLYHAPARVLHRGNRTKALARDFLARRIPEVTGAWSTSMYADIPLQRAMGRELKQVWRPFDGLTFLGEFGIVAPSDFRAALDDLHESTPLRQLEWMWAVISAEVWLREAST
jgi:asparagine synthetase B (glutamine-hydrolysing)